MHLLWVEQIQTSEYDGLLTLIPLLRISIFCHFGSTSFVLPIRPKDGILNRGIRVQSTPINSNSSIDFDISGKLITHKNIQEKNFKVGFSSLAAGTYLMVFSNSQQNLKTIKVQKSL